MKVLIKSAKILDASSPHHNTKKDVFIENGLIKKIDFNINYLDAIQIEFEDLHISQGWFDSSVSFGEPGFEERETISNGLNVAASSGFTSVAYNTNTSPCPESRADISFILSQSKGVATSIHPKARITINSINDKLAPMRELFEAGAVSFSNHKSPIANANTLKLALQYSNDFNGLVESFALNTDLANQGVMHEGDVSTYLGLPGIPSLAEEIQVKRDLDVLKYTGGKLHIPTISTKNSVQLIKKAKESGLDISCSVAVSNLFFNDSAMKNFNSNAKLLPPLRESTDINALKKAVLNETIDMVTSDHQPLNVELKKVEIDNAYYGTISIEQTFSALLSLFSLENTIRILTKGKNRFGIANGSIKEGDVAHISLFTPTGEYKVSKNDLKSTSKNCLFINENLPGKVYGVITDTNVHIVK
jgi:dihydroorotase